MPSIKDKLKIESHNERTIRLWPEGTFYKAYERSAYLFVTKVRSYEVRCRYYDSAGQNVLSIGFPRTVLEKLGLPYTEGDDGLVTIKMDSEISEQQFLLWREEQIHPRTEQKSTSETVFTARIRSLNLASMTPMQCMMLLSEWQSDIMEDSHGA